jgi:hypothetical protein
MGTILQHEITDPRMAELDALIAAEGGWHAPEPREPHSRRKPTPRAPYGSKKRHEMERIAQQMRDKGRAAALARAAKLSPERRREIAVHACLTRWYGEYERLECPRCGGRDTHLNGSRDGKPRARCRDCGRQWQVVLERAMGMEVGS